MSPAARLVTWQLRAQFAAGLSVMYASEVPAYTTLVEVNAQVNRDDVDRDTEAAHMADDCGYSIGWMAGAVGRHIYDPHALYEALSQEAPREH
jgi:uncharacterized glyoxalase superfamily metalloenzyme YdcJ